MASDISNIIKSEIINTLESLLSVSAKITDSSLIENDNFAEEQCINVESKFEYSNTESTWNFFIPTITGAKFEYLMLGGIADLKESIDDEIADAVKEIVSTICGSIVTNINAQGFQDISDTKFSLTDSKIVQCNTQTGNNNLYKITISINDEDIPIFINFDDSISPFVESLSNNTNNQNKTEVVEENNSANSGNGSVIASLLGEDSVDNLRLLFDIKLRLSVRLGTKVCLLRDVISWDIGEIIELTQMLSEPLDILVNGVVIGAGEAVIVDGKFGVKIKYIGKEKIN
ncbi:MAG: FliM/FliN family flagellar motor switch protein [Campylobacterota bacterium]|nr:FliM/FliN family flagellar motor switch protein [Campylobacterota bacterium]